LARAEAVLGVIEADNPRQLDAALRQLAGGVSTPIRRLRDELLDLLAELEAGFDFADEDLDLFDHRQADRRLLNVGRQIDRLRRQMRSRGRSADAVAAVLVGLPNSGKSSLFNALLGRQAAVVHAAPGTTRDYLIGRLDLDGVPCQLIDTAGVPCLPGERQPDSKHAHGKRGHGTRLDALSADQTGEAAELAHLRIVCIDQSRPLESWESDTLARRDPGCDLAVLTKGDLPAAAQRVGREDHAHRPAAPPPPLRTSARSGEGLDALRRRLRELVVPLTSADGPCVTATAARCRHAVERAGEAVVRARGCLGRTDGEELAAAELRLALDELGRVVGAVYTDDVLDRLFGKFCIGK
ncbi:MAG: GTPase, partial [Pirellulales bacterium]